ncbi:hypothetical protein HAALTHF_22060n [Vreelandella aquamarina]|nr:hypothetical protein HAALTHF_22060n [Halomonas axialensis]
MQRNGTLVDTLAEHEKEIRLLVLGKRGKRPTKPAATWALTLSAWYVSFTVPS